MLAKDLTMTTVTDDIMPCRCQVIGYEDRGIDCRDP